VIGLYAIAIGAPPRAVGARGEPVRVVARGRLAAVCGDPPPPLSVEALRAHEAAVRRIADGSEACLPARFGAAAGGEEQLLDLLAARERELLEALELVRGREQMNLRVQGAAAPAPSSGGPGTRYLEGRRRATRLPELDPLRSALAALIRGERIEAHEQPGLIASVYHLIDRGASAGYRQAVEGAALDGVRLSVSGPWPPWSFAPELSP
jgi:Gas vesicle synthesis protein GvpL/GvpF